MKCDNCNDIAEVNFTYLASVGVQSINLCGCCSAHLWDRYKHTPAFQTLICSEPKSKKEISNVKD